MCLDMYCHYFTNLRKEVNHRIDENARPHPLPAKQNDGTSHNAKSPGPHIMCGPGFNERSLMETKGRNQMRTSSSNTGAMGRLQPWWSVCSR